MLEDILIFLAGFESLTARAGKYCSQNQVFGSLGSGEDGERSWLGSSKSAPKLCGGGSMVSEDVKLSEVGKSPLKRVGIRCGCTWQVLTLSKMVDLNNAWWDVGDI